MGRNEGWFNTRRAADVDAADEAGVELYDVLIVRETDAALLVMLDEKHEHREVWIPKSQIKDESAVKGGDDTGTLVITQWIAEQKDIA